LQHCSTEPLQGDGATQYSEPSPDYFTYVDHGGPGLVPAGYGYRSVAYTVERALELQGAKLEARQAKLAEWDAAGILATPANSSFNDRLIEAARISIQERGRPVAVSAPRD
jgi:hypothetical protein